MKVCAVCFKRRCSIHGNRKVEIDDDILDTIKLLNDKGYTTEYCCAGHSDTDETSTQIYIKFNVWDIQAKKRKLPDTLPNEKWVCYPRHIENHHLVWSHKLSANGQAMYYNIKGLKRRKRADVEAELQEQRRELHKWAESLEQQ